MAKKIVDGINSKSNLYSKVCTNKCIQSDFGLKFGLITMESKAFINVFDRNRFLPAWNLRHNYLQASAAVSDANKMLLSLNVNPLYELDAITFLHMCEIYFKDCL